MDIVQRFRQSGRRYLKSAFRNGFFHIIGGNTIVKIITFLSNFLLLRLLTKQQYGLFTLPNNILNIVLLFNGLGMSTAILRYCTIIEDEREKKAYFRYAVRFGLAFDAFLVLFSSAALYLLNKIPQLLHGSPVYPVTGQEAQLLILLALIPFLAFAFDMIQYFLRAERDNRNYSRTSVLFTGAFGIFQVVFVLFMKVYGIVAGRYLAYAVSITVGCMLLLRKPSIRVKAAPLRREEKRGIRRFAFTALLSTCFSLVMPYIETFIVNYFVLDLALRAEFNVASLAPQSIQFLTSAVAVYIFPFFAKNYRNGKWLLENTKKLYLALIIGIGLIVGAGILLTPAIIQVFCGPQYTTAQEIALMRVFWVAFGVNSALKMPTGNILAAVGEVRFNTINAMVSTLLQTVICWELISRYQIRGAAYGLLCGYLLSSVIGILYLLHYCRRQIKKPEPCPAAVEIEQEEEAS